MKARLTYLVLLLLVLGCIQQKQQTGNTEEEQALSKLDQLLLLSKDSVIAHCNLSDDQISTFPDLSEYNITSLDLSHNAIDTIIVQYLPQGLQTLNLSYNRIGYFPDFSDHHVRTLSLSHNEIDTVRIEYLPKDLYSLDLSYNLLKGIFDLSLSEDSPLYKERTRYYDSHPIREVNISHNHLTGFDIGFSLRKIVVSYNDITYMDFSHGNIEYLDVSHNPHLSNVNQWEPSQIDTIIRNNIANDKELMSSILRVIIECPPPDFSFKIDSGLKCEKVDDL